MTAKTDDVVVGEVLEVYDDGGPPATLFHTDDPGEILVRAGATADALAKVVRDPKRKLIAKISGREFPLVEAWTLLGTMLGVYPIVVWSRPMEDGWEARVEARTRDGAIVGAAEAQCTRAERNWGKRDDYALRSMAQTRAASKALRQPLGFVMTLAGLEATPAEEMPTTDTRPDPHTPSGPTVDDLRAGIARLGPTNPDWTEEAVLASASASFKRPIAFLEELTQKELGQIIAAMPADSDDDIPFA